MIKVTTFRNNKKKDWFSHKTGLVFVHGDIFKDGSGNSAAFKMELFATTGNGKKLQRASSNLWQNSWVCTWFLRFSSLCAIDFNTQCKYEEQIFNKASNQVFIIKVLSTLRYICVYMLQKFKVQHYYQHHQHH